jgi:hypothetical protein
MDRVRENSQNINSFKTGASRAATPEIIEKARERQKQMLDSKYQRMWLEELFNRSGY